MWIYYCKLAWVSIQKNLGMAILMVLTIAIGIAACLTTLTMYMAVSSNPLSEKNNILFTVQLDSWDPNQTHASTNSVPQQLTYRDATALLDAPSADQKVAMFAAGLTCQHVDKSGEPKVERTRVTTRDFFSMFGVKFIYGGPWNERDDLAPNRVVVINETINLRLFDGHNSVGREILIEDELFTVVGVVADDWRLIPKVYDLNVGAFKPSAAMYVPFYLVAFNHYNVWGNFQNWSDDPISSYREFLQSETVWLQFWVTLNNEQQKSAFAQYIEGYIQQQKEQGRFQRPIKYYLNTPKEWLDINKVVGNDDRILVGLSIAFFLVCIVNTIVMLLAKFLRKAPEAGVRRALGATRLAIFSQHLIECLTIGIIGGLFGLGLSWFGLAGVRQLYQNYSHVAVLSTYTVALSLLLAIIASLISGALPAWYISRTQPAKYLKEQ